MKRTLIVLVIFCLSTTMALANSMGPVKKFEEKTEAVGAGYGSVKVKPLSLTPVHDPTLVIEDPVDPYYGWIEGQPWAQFDIGETAYFLGYLSVRGTGVLNAKAIIKDAAGKVIDKFSYDPMFVNEPVWAYWFISRWLDIDPAQTVPGFYTLTIKLILPNGTVKKISTKAEVVLPPS